MKKLMGIISAKGGVGKTLLAANLAAAFALEHRQRAALIDLSPGLGAADLLLDLKPERSWMDLKDVLHELTPQHLQLAATPHRSGLDLLACPARAEWDPPLPASELAVLLEALRSKYDLVVIDTQPGLCALSRAVLEFVDLRLILLTPDAPALRATSRYLEALPGGGPPIGLVVNQFSRGAPITPTEIEEYLGKTLLGVLPIDPRAVWLNVGCGNPCLLHKSSRLGRAIRALSTRVMKTLQTG